MIFPRIRAGQIGLALVVVPISSCGWWAYYSVFSTPSPDGHNVIRVMRNHRGDDADYMLRIEVSTPQATDVIYDDNREAALGLIDAYWSADSKQVEVLSCNLLSGKLLIGYNVDRHETLSAEVLAPMLAEQIRQEYGLATGADVFHWACSDGGRYAYRERNKRPPSN